MHRSKLLAAACRAVWFATRAVRRRWLSAGISKNGGHCYGCLRIGAEIDDALLIDPRHFMSQSLVIPQVLYTGRPILSLE